MSNDQIYPPDEIVSLIRSLDRKEDNHLFSEDVVKTYPHLAEMYVKMCPERCDLHTAADKAAGGFYSSDPTLRSLKQDVTLMSKNCIRFNGEKTEFAETAVRFEAFAIKKIEDYILEKTGGKRVSSMRLQNSKANHNSSPSAASSTVAEVFTPKDALALVNSLVRRDDQGAFEVDVAEAYPELKESYEAVCPHPMTIPMMRKRAQEGLYSGGASSHINHRNPTTAARRDANNSTGSSISQTTSSVFANTIADSLLALREDVELIVNNCVRYNAAVEMWVKQALSFQRFAHEKIDQCVIRHAPRLRGTTTGASVFIAAVPTPRPLPTAASGGQAQTQSEISVNSTPSAILLTSTSPTPISSAATVLLSGGSGNSNHHSNNNKKRTREETKLPPVVEVQNHIYTATVAPTPLQPNLQVPAVLRARILADHMRRDTLKARLLGGKHSKKELLPSLPAASLTEEESKAENESKKSENETNSKEKKEKDKKDEKNEKGEEDVEVVISAELVVEAVLRAFEDACENFFHKQRTREDFNDPFQFSVKEQETYTSIISMIRTQFNALFESLLLYPLEKADIGEWVLQRMLNTVDEENSTQKKEKKDQAEQVQHEDDKGEQENNKNSAIPVWSEVVHVSYLVRFIVHFPQIIALACSKRKNSHNSSGAAAMYGDSNSATTFSNNGFKQGGSGSKTSGNAQLNASHGSNANSSSSPLVISKDLLEIVQQVAAVSQDLLAFVLAYEKRVLS